MRKAENNMALQYSPQKELHKITIIRGKRGSFSPVQPDHYHPYYEIFYLLAGNCTFLLKDSIYHLNKGDLVCIAPGELHHSIYLGSSCEIIYLHFKNEYLDMDMMKRWLPPEDLKKLSSFMGSIPTIYQEDFQALLFRMLSESSTIDEYSDAFMNCFLQEIILFLMRHSVMNEEEPELTNARDADIMAATKYIYKNFRKPLTLDEVAGVASLSPTYFSRKFKLVTGMGFKEYLNYVRLRHAQTALLTTNNTITDIALEYGFNDSNYFKDIFKKFYGLSPREFRKNPDGAQE